VAQSAGPELKPQDHTKKKKKRKHTVGSSQRREVCALNAVCVKEDHVSQKPHKRLLCRLHGWHSHNLAAREAGKVPAESNECGKA
jgi:hypothetical protein